jgi:hypothetical protein
MSREQVCINLSSQFPHEAAAAFLAALAYPNSTDHSLRDRFARALCRYEVLKRATNDPNYRINLQLIPPIIFKDQNTTFWSALQKGHNKLKQRLTSTYTVVIMPFLAQDAKERSIHFFSNASINFLSKLGTKLLGWSGDSQSTYKSKVWSETRQVAHAAIAYMIVVVIEKLELCMVSKLDARVIAEIMRNAEDLIPKLTDSSLVRRVRLKEDQLVRFTSCEQANKI